MNCYTPTRSRCHSFVILEDKHNKFITQNKSQVICMITTHQRRKTMQIMFCNSTICTAAKQPSVVPSKTLDTAVTYQRPIDVWLVWDVPYFNWCVWSIDQNNRLVSNCKNKSCSDVPTFLRLAFVSHFRRPYIGSKEVRAKKNSPCARRMNPFFNVLYFVVYNIIKSSIYQQTCVKATCY